MLQRFIATITLVAILVLTVAPELAVAQDEPPDLAKYGFSKVIASRKVDPTKLQGVRVGPYNVVIPAGTFAKPVRFQVLAGAPEDFAFKAPKGEVPVLAFAFRITDEETGKLVGQFAKPVAFTASDNKIARDSRYYNILADGTYRANPAGLQVRPGDLRHPIAGAMVGWVLTAPAPGFASWPYVEPVVRVFYRGRMATVVVWVQNNSSEDLTNIDVRAKIPAGASVIKTWAGNPESNRAANDGVSVGWMNSLVPAGRLQGPFVMQVDTGGKPVSTSVWLRFKARTFGGESVSDSVTARWPVAPPNATVMSR